MKYKLSTISTTRSILLIIAYIISWFSSFIVSGLYFKNEFLFFLTFLGGPVLFLLNLKFIFLTKIQTIFLSDEGFELIEDRVKVKWSEIKWYIELNSGINGFYHRISLKLENGKKVYIVFYKKNTNETDWFEFKTAFFDLLKKNNSDIYCFYNSRIWKTVVRLIIVSNLLIPVFLILLQLKIFLILTLSLSFLGSSLSFIAFIRNNEGVS